MGPLGSFQQFMPDLAKVAGPQAKGGGAGMIPEAELKKLGLDKMTPQPLEAPKIALTNQLPGLGGVNSGGGAFSDTLSRLVSEVGVKQAAASDAVGGLLSGQAVPLHQAMIAMEESSVSFQLMVEVRNKLLESYQELMRMQI